ncbi:MAG TPA: hypothetical protein VLI39_05560 [Sedimentisphaerales bacterium]|nr:hypothetical protein [Sedimentisphaerales bacterium]
MSSPHSHPQRRLSSFLCLGGITVVCLTGMTVRASNQELPATFAGVLSDRVTQATLKNSLTSYQEIAESREYAWPLSTLVPNVLSAFDLPDCYRALEAKNLRQIEPWGPVAKP